jgi:hypothetical protein
LATRLTLSTTGLPLSTRLTLSTTGLPLSTGLTLRSAAARRTRLPAGAGLTF